MDDGLISFEFDPLQDKYDRLLDDYERLQKLNQSLEDKLLKIGEGHHLSVTHLTKQLHNLTQKLVEGKHYIQQLEDENDRYRNDINVVIQLLHCKPSSFISPKMESLPDDLQRKVLVQKNNGGSVRKEKKIIKVQVPTFPPTDIMYSVDKNKDKTHIEKDNIVSAAIMAKILEEREKERDENVKNRCLCSSRIIIPTVDGSTQTLPSCTISCIDFNEILKEKSDDCSINNETLITDSLIHFSPVLKNTLQSSSSSLSSSNSKSSPDSLFNFSSSSSISNKRAGHCVRVIDEKIGGENEPHWSSTVLVHEPKIKSDYYYCKSDITQSSPKESLSSYQDIEDSESESSLIPHNNISNNNNTHLLSYVKNQLPYQQYYRAQKRSFWTRSSSTTSTETEI